MSAFIGLLTGLISLVALETVLGLDNIVFIGILSDKLPAIDRPKARVLGLIGALGTRVLLLLTLSWLAGMTAPFFSVFGHGFSVKDVILLVGGVFLIWKSTMELHHLMENGSHGSGTVTKKVTLWGTIGTIMRLK
jgi:predicted tellurium resistance membrane protein TerC